MPGGVGNGSLDALRHCSRFATDEDYDSLIELAGDRRFVLIGEASTEHTSFMKSVLESRKG